MKGKKSILLIVCALLTAALLGGGGYYAYYKKVKEPRMYAMPPASAEAADTKWIGIIGSPVMKWDGSLYEEEAYENAGQLLEMMYVSNAEYFFVERQTDGDRFNVWETDQASFAERLGDVGQDDVTMDLGKRLKEFLETDGNHIYADQVEWFGKQSVVDNDLMTISMGDEEPYEYFNDRKLRMTCSSVSPVKIAVMHNTNVTENGNEAGEQPFFCAWYKATVTTESCEGISFFPEAGETGDILIGVTAQPRGDECEFQFLYFEQGDML